MKRAVIVSFITVLAVTLVSTAPPKQECAQNGVPNDSQNDRWMHPDLPVMNTVNLKNQAELTSEYWRELGMKVVKEHNERKENKNIAKNIIFFLGDGLSVPTITATRSYVSDDSEPLSFEKFPYTGMSKTYCVDRQVADSACTATAYLGGVKANFETIGVSARVPNLNCDLQKIPVNQIKSIAQWALDANKAAGLVTTTRVTHASPAGIYAHIANRDWEADANVAIDCNAADTDDIARQLIRGVTGKGLRVIMGGGRREFRHKDYVDEEGSKGKRLEDVDLIQEWVEQKSGEGTYIWNRKQLLDLNPNNTRYLLGLFEPSHCQYNLETKLKKSEEMEPTLTEMTEKAIDILSTEENGYFLFVEGGRIDHAHHDTWAHIALDETAEFSKAIEMAAKKVNLEETLIVVTADHSHSFSYSGYPNRDANILGTTGSKALDGLEYFILSYANGMGYYDHVKPEGGRVDPAEIKWQDDIYQRYPATAPHELETHGGDDVSVYAIGPWAHLFTGNFEQNVIPHFMGYAACIGNGLKACDEKK